MALPLDACSAAEYLDCRVQGCGKRRKVRNAFVNLQPRRGIIATAQPPWQLAAMCGHAIQQRIDPVSGQAGLRWVNAVIDKGALHLFGQGVGQRFQVQRGAVGSFQVQGPRIRAFDLRYGQHVVAAGGRRCGVDYGSSGLALDVVAV